MIVFLLVVIVACLLFGGAAVLSFIGTLLSIPFLAGMTISAAFDAIWMPGPLTILLLFFAGALVLDLLGLGRKGIHYLLHRPHWRQQGFASEKEYLDWANRRGGEGHG
jgi:hypothetical protein